MNADKIIEKLYEAMDELEGLNFYNADENENIRLFLERTRLGIYRIQKFFEPDDEALNLNREIEAFERQESF